VGDMARPLRLDSGDGCDGGEERGGNEPGVPGHAAREIKSQADPRLSPAVLTGVGRQ